MLTLLGPRWWKIIRDRGAAISALLVAFIAQPAVADSNSQDEYQNIHTIALISTIGSSFYIQDRPFFGDPKDYTLHPDWGIDARAKQQIRKLLGGRFQILDVPDNAVSTDLQFAILNRPTEATKQALKTLNLPPTVDAILVLHPYAGPIGSGLGMSHFSGPIGKPGTMVFAGYQASILDAKSFDQIDYGTAKHPDGGIYGGHMLPLEQCPETFWSDTPEQLVGEREQMLRDEIVALVQKSLPYALASAHLMRESDIPDQAASGSGAICSPP
ncbi:MAG TPA: hypothetical protein VGM17_00210 [Rhizomicrobium sp.]